MFGTLLYFVSLTVLARCCFRGLSPASRLAAAALVALAAPILVLVIAARLGLNPSPPLVCAAHALLWIVAGWQGISRPGRSEGSVLPGAFLALVVALLTALLGPDPAERVLVDAWAHLAWSHSLATSTHAYAPGFPAFLATLTPFGVLVGAFRCSALVLHFALACGFLALGSRNRERGLGALAALAYLLVPAAGPRFEPPAPELLSAVLLAGCWWVAGARDLSERARTVALGALTLAILISHISALEIALLGALALAIMVGVNGSSARARVAALSSLVAGGLVATALSPWLVDLVFAPESVRLVALQPGSVEALNPRTVARMLGIALGGLLLVGAFPFVRNRRTVEAREFVLAATLLLAAAALLAPMALSGLGVQVPLQLFTDRLLMAAALPLALLAAVLLGSGSPRRTGRDLAPALSVAVVALAQVVRPAAPWLQVGLALVVAALASLALRAWPWRQGAAFVGAPRGTAAAARLPGIAAVIAVLGLGLAARLWIWTPQLPPEASWLRAASAEIPVLTNWPVVNELDALLEARVLDGLAGRDANLALHRRSFSTALRDRLAWCGAGGDAAEIDAYLRECGIPEAYLVVDDRFESAWRTYRAQREAILASPQPAASRLLRSSSCESPATQRLAEIRASLRAWPRAEVSLDAPGTTIFHVRRPKDDPSPAGR